MFDSLSCEATQPNRRVRDGRLGFVNRLGYVHRRSDHKSLRRTIVFGWAVGREIPGRCVAKRVRPPFFFRCYGGVRRYRNGTTGGSVFFP